ncbi:hypothetical protein [Cerasicoccus frondis]|uniref:hypothetical protein n=1 Tax=Cerasicoccus frondis TaxID=490090 RepID=UPI00285288A5|nr:hypothetical protein [Cerasicoccus frondis]
MEGKVLLAKLLALFTDRLNQELLNAIDYLQEEVRVLQHHLKKKCPKLVDAQRKVLAEKAKKLGKAIEKYTNLVTPDTLYRWHRKLVAQKFDGSKKRQYPGRPRKPKNVKGWSCEWLARIHALALWISRIACVISAIRSAKKRFVRFWSVMGLIQ